MGYETVLGGLVRSPDDEARVLREGACVTLVGRLSVVGEAIEHLHGARVAARTITPVPVGEHSHGKAFSQRSPRLCVIVEHESVELQGAVEVVLGSENQMIHALEPDLREQLQELCGGLRGFDADGLSYRVLHDGDHVRVFGRVYLGASSNNTGSYRQSARSWRLHSAALACMKGRDHPECVIPLVVDNGEDTA